MCIEILARDVNGNLSHFRDKNGQEFWVEYDANGNATHTKTSSGFEEWAKFNKSGILVQYRNSISSIKW